MPERIVEKFRVKEGSNRDKLLMVLARNLGKTLTFQEAMDAVYGKKKGSTTAFARVIAGVRSIIERRALSYEIVEAKTSRGKTIALHYFEPGCKIFAAGTTAVETAPEERLTDQHRKVA